MIFAFFGYLAVPHAHEQELLAFAVVVIVVSFVAEAVSVDYPVAP